MLRPLATTLFRTALKAEHLLRPKPKTPPTQILILAYMPALGYAVQMTPVFEALRQALPNTRITVATRNPYLEALRHSPHVDDLLETPDPMTSLPAAITSLRRQLKERNLTPDCVLTGPADRRTVIGLLGAAACAGRRGGFAVTPELYHQPLTYDTTKSRLANNVRLMELLTTQPVAAPSPKIFVSPADATHAHTLLAGTDRGNGILAVIPANSGGLPTAWLDDRWAQVVRHASEQLGLGIIYLGAARDATRIDHIQQLAGGIGTSLAGQTTVSQLAAVLTQTDLTAAIVTGGMHVAQAAGTPIVLLAPQWEPPLEWLPTNREDVHILQAEIDLERHPDYTMQETEAEAVNKALTAMLQRFPPSQEARQTRLQASLSQVDLLPQRPR